MSSLYYSHFTDVGTKAWRVQWPSQDHPTGSERTQVTLIVIIPGSAIRVVGGEKNRGLTRSPLFTLEHFHYFMLRQYFKHKLRFSFNLTYVLP